MPQYYAWNEKAIRFSERWKMRRNVFQFVLAFLGRKLGMSMPSSPRLRPAGIEHIEEHDLPQSVRTHFVRSVEEMKRWGLQFCFFNRAPEKVLDGRDQGVAATFIDSSFKFWAGLAWIRVVRAPVVVERCPFQCVTPLDDGSFLTTTNYAQRFELPPARKVQCLPNAEPQQIIEAHRRWLQSLESFQAAHLTAETLDGYLLAYVQQFFDHMVARRLLVPIEATVPVWS